MNKLYLWVGVGAIAAIAVVFLTSRQTPEAAVASSPSDSGRALTSISVPPLDGNAAIGEKIFNQICAACHGANAAGVDGSGPPLVHKIYGPGHHADEAFQRAVANGVRSHHWRFGNMPPVEGLTRGDVAMVVT